MHLYYTPGTISIVVAITLEEAGLDYTTTKVNFAEAEQTKAPYLAKNPKGRVPTLEVQGQLLTETGALLEYIAASAPQAGLVPADPLAAAQMRGVMYYLASTMHINHAHKMRGSRWADLQSSFDDMTAKVPQTMAASARYIEDHALQGPFVMGDTLSLADPYLFVVCNWLKGDGVDPSDYPRISRFMAAMETRASVKAVRANGMLP
ncbi:glutathione S-transferase family protein [Pseudosulfitobacter sp. DSM 107133]|uniref:glutathione S-transferase family protein n=1 Tax=Pseudosulfitobacter sp. DSM 107133 TaxID=2883100 RepID=UPI000DF39E28|nr:glutathione S-transferase family protein [Pseudosulfitobacter sp. DSM 107133]UOA25639.1 Glutathione S-transferase GST-6.0 [Pseudosulfitobacter sp. DSM 107133]